MQILQSSGDEFRVGDRIRARGQRWLVGRLDPFDDCTLVTLTGADTANHGVERRLLTPFDRLAPTTRRRRLRLVSRARWRRACRGLLAHDGPAPILRTALSARMDLLPYQLEPALAVARGLGSRLLIADDVGLGKTVQAGLIIAELLARGAASRVLVLTPAGLREQWREELEVRFRLHFALLDAATVRRRRHRVPAGVNPWSTDPLVVASTDYVKQSDVMRAVLAIPWDLVVVDEAHGVTSGSDRHAAVSTLCRNVAHVVLLTATPHSGDSAAFAALCAIGERGDRLLVFRRTRADVGMADRRRVHQLIVRPTEAERRMFASLDRLATAVDRDARQQPGAALAVAMLTKRALSSPWSLERSLERRLACLNDARLPMSLQVSLPFWDDVGEHDAEDAAPTWAQPLLRDSSEERALLGQLSQAAGRAGIEESKLKALRRLLRRIHEPVIVFTEYRDTLAHVHETVAPSAALLHGGLSREERQAALAQFERGALLLATDAAGEGLNLHHRCRVVINLELPWNPMRLEQRIGRVDRIGQQRRVHAFHLIAAGTEDLSLKARLVARVARARAEVGAADPLGTGAAGTDQTHTPLVRLSVEAADAAQQLHRARAVVRRGAASLWAFDEGPLAVKARGPLRIWLGARTLVVAQSLAVTWSGHVVASHVTAWLCRAGRTPWRLEELERLSAAVQDPSIARWRDETAQTHGAFWQRRLQREVAIADDLTSRLPAGVQPGLFDLRALHTRARGDERWREATREAGLRIEAARRWGGLTIEATVPVLVVYP